MDQKDASNRRNENAESDEDESPTPPNPASIQITFYTDPLCCWSWAMEEPIRLLADKFGQSLSTTYKMAGLLPSWGSFSDAINSIQKPAQMGPEWMYAKQIT